MVPPLEWLFRALIQYGLANPSQWQALVSGQAVLISQQGGMYISESMHGGKRTSFAFPQASSGQSIPMLTIQALIAKADWVIRNFSATQISNYMMTYPQDYTVATYW
jgi:hypothetical protein